MNQNATRIKPAITNKDPTTTSAINTALIVNFRLSLSLRRGRKKRKKVRKEKKKNCAVLLTCWNSER